MRGSDTQKLADLGMPSAIRIYAANLIECPAFSCSAYIVAQNRSALIAEAQG